MADKILNVRIQAKYDTEANWKAKNTVLLKGEVAYTSDGTNANKYKVGDGTSKWSALSYAKADLSKGDVTTALGYTPPTSNTWRGIQNNLTSDSITDSLSAAQGKVLKGLVDGKAASSHIHDDRYYTETEINTKLSGKSDTGHTHNYAGSNSVGGSANSAVKLDTARNISLDTAVSATATSFDGSKNISIPVNSVKEAYLSWGGRNFSGSYGPIDAAMIPNLGANRLAFGSAAGITVQYSRDSGTTWIDYGATDSSKKGLLANGESFIIGKADSNNKATASYMLRIILDTDKIPVYTALNKFALYISTNGSSGSYCTIDASLESSPTTFKTFANKIPLSGWSGWNIINTETITTYGNSPSIQYGLVRFTFGCTGGSANYNGLQIYRIMGFGGVGWTTPSNMASIGSIYNYDINQNVTFPAQVTATQFNGNATSATKLGDAVTAQWGGQISTTSWFAAFSPSTDGQIRAISLTNVKSVLGISKVNNTADADKSVKYATSSGSATTATALSTSAGSATQPVYFSSGKPVACTYTLGKSVPSNAVFTDTNTWIAFKGATTSAAGTAGYAPAPTAGAANRYLRSDGTWAVPPDTNTTYGNMTAATSSAAGKAGLVPAPAAGKQTSFLRGDGTWVVPTNTVYTHPTTSGNKHIPSGGSSGQILRWSADGTAVWGADNNTTYSAFKGATTSAAGGSGLVPAPATGNVNQYLRGDGTWATPTNTTYADATTSAHGLMTAAMVTKLNGIAAGANAYSHPGYTARSAGLYKITVDGTGHVSAVTAVSKADITALGIPGSDTNTDTKVTQTTVKSADYTNWRPIIWGSSNSGTEGFTPTTVTDSVFSDPNLTYQPSSGTLRATTFKGNLTGTASSANAVAWGNVSGKPSTFTPASHTHSYAGSSSAGGSATSAVKLDTSTAGSATQPVYFTGGKPTACTYTLGKSVPSNAIFTDTTYSVFTAASASSGGSKGLVPAPAAGKQDAYLKGDGTWAIPSSSGLPLDGSGTMTGAIVSSVSSNSYLNANKGVAIINSTAGRDNFVALAKMNGSDGIFTTGVFKSNYFLYYTVRTDVANSKNNFTYGATLLNSSGNTTFPGIVTAKSYANTSDIRLKKNVSDTQITDALSIINKMKLRQFDWKADNKHQEIGFIADELQAIDKNLVTGGGNDQDGNIIPKAIDSFYLLSYVVKGIQELSKEVSDLRQENELLKQQLNI